MWPFKPRSNKKLLEKFQQGTKALNRGDLKTAEALLLEVCQIEPTNVGALLNLGIVYHRAGKHSKAIELFECVTQERPRETRAFVNLAAAENALGHLDRAEAALIKALGINPRQAGVHYNLAVIYMKRNDYVNAMAEFELELAINPHHAESEAAIRVLRQQLMPRG